MIRQGLLWSSLFLALSVAASLYAAATLDLNQIVPVHWALDGKVNRWAPLRHVIWLVPALNIVLIALLAVLPRLDPRRENLQRSAGLYLAAWIGGVGIATAAHLAILYGAVAGREPPMRYLFLVVGAFMAIIGNFLAKSRSNFFAGVRTPWTLSSEHAWKVANRLAGWGLVVTGLATIAAALALNMASAAATLLVGALLSTGVAVIVSYFAWRNDPERSVD